ncbi:MAG: hypothetical protein ACFFE8_13380 [Candidatus Heimdallarchaeota archaeon]
MSSDSEYVSLEDAKKEVQVALTRLALLHLSFSKTIIEELGRERGENLIIKSIKEYGRRIIDSVKKGGQDLPRWGVYSKLIENEDGKLTAYGCTLAKIFRDQNELEFGRFYCYVDAAKSMASNPKEKFIHLTCATCGDDHCSFDVLPTTEEERMAYENNDITRWKFVDPTLRK